MSVAPFNTNFFGFLKFGKIGEFVEIFQAFTNSMHNMSQLQWIGVLTIGLGATVICMACVGAFNQLTVMRMNRRTS